MIKCYFVDVKSIRSNLPKSSFDKAEIDLLADAILETDGLLRPLILQKNGVEKYTVIEGHRDYYAAVRAKEKDINKAEMVNAFIIDPHLQKSAIEQLKLLTQPQPPSAVIASGIDPDTLNELLSSTIDRLLPTITAAISIQLQPIVSQLVEHQQILDTIKLALISDSITDSKKSPESTNITPPAIKVEPSVQNIKPVTGKSHNSKKTSKLKDTLESPISNSIESPQAPNSPNTQSVEVTKTTPKSSKKNKSEDKLYSSISTIIEPGQQVVTTVTSTKTTKPAETKKKSAAVESIDAVKFDNALNLINTLSQEQLMVRMERSGISKSIVKLAESIIVKRNTQSAQKFDTWAEIVAVKIGGLGAVKIKEIMQKLK
jgi:ParB-like nuclease domain